MEQVKRRKRKQGMRPNELLIVLIAILGILLVAAIFVAGSLRGDAPDPTDATQDQTQQTEPSTQPRPTIELSVADPA